MTNREKMIEFRRRFESGEEVGGEIDRFFRRLRFRGQPVEMTHENRYQFVCRTTGDMEHAQFDLMMREGY